MRHVFRIVALPDPQTLPRIAGIFAQRSLVPPQMAVDCREDMLHIEARLDDLDQTTAQIIAAKLTEAVLVASANCHTVPDARDPKRQTASQPMAAA